MERRVITVVIVLIFCSIAAAYPHSYRRESYYGGNVARTSAVLMDDMNEVATEEINIGKL